MSQHGAQEVVEPPTDGVSNSICSRPVGGGGSNLPSCSLVTEEMLDLLIRGANRQSIKTLNTAVHLSFSLFIFHHYKTCRTQLHAALYVVYLCVWHWMMQDRISASLE